MAWTISARAKNRYGTGPIMLSETALARGTTTAVLTWDPATILGGSQYDGLPLEILGVRYEIIASATVGNRIPILRLLHSTDDVLFEGLNQSVTAAGVTDYYEWAQGYAPSTAGIEDTGLVIRCAFPMNLFVCPGQKLSVGLSADVDTNGTTGDQAQVHVRARVAFE